VDTALSIQSHPDKELAGRLHAERPQVQPVLMTEREGDQMLERLIQ